MADAAITTMPMDAGSPKGPLFGLSFLENLSEMS